MSRDSIRAGSAGAIVGAPPSQFCAAFLTLKVLAPGAEFSGTLTWTGTAVSEGPGVPQEFVGPGDYIVNGGTALAGADGATVSQAGVDHVPAHITIVR